MRVRIDEAGRNGLAARIDHRGAWTYLHARVQLVADE
jgi:hypothetical protein